MHWRRFYGILIDEVWPCPICVVALTWLSSFTSQDPAHFRSLANAFPPFVVISIRANKGLSLCMKDEDERSPRTQWHYVYSCNESYSWLSSLSLCLAPSRSLSLCMCVYMYVYSYYLDICIALFWYTFACPSRTLSVWLSVVCASVFMIGDCRVISGPFNCTHMHHSLCIDTHTHACLHL